MASQSAILKRGSLSLTEKLRDLHWPLVALIMLLGVIGCGALYSAAGGSHEPWASRHGLRLALGLVVMLCLALIDIRHIFRAAYGIYGVVFALLVAVEITGELSKGAQRWIDLGFMQLQPSELMKLALALALARYFHSSYIEEVRRPLHLVVPVLLILAPAMLVLRQPDLGTAIMLLAVGGVMLFLAGVHWWKFLAVGSLAAAAMPVIWSQLHAYQQQRVFTFLNPESDPLGSGYHIIQSKIALGAGGLWGRGFVEGSQAQLNFLPEKHTDFAFTMLAEESGFVGAITVLAIFLAIILLAFVIALRAQSHFGRLLVMGLGVNFTLYVVINVAMVTGLIPVVGVPMPLISYGGTAMLTVLVGLGLTLAVDVERDTSLPRFPAEL